MKYDIILKTLVNRRFKCLNVSMTRPFLYHDCFKF